MTHPAFKYSKIAFAISIITSSLILTGCSGGGGTASESVVAVPSTTSSLTTTVSRGIITGFGSVYVNGIKFETDNSAFSIDDIVETTQDNLRVGMVVTINGTVNADGSTGFANFIQYNNDLKGPISAFTLIDLTTKEITVLGQTIIVTSDTVFDDDDNESTLTFASLNASSIGVIVEISGLETANGLNATHIEQQDNTNSDGKIEILGAIENFSGSSLTDITFQVLGFSIQTDGSTVLDDFVLTDLKDGVFVEIKGILDAAGTLLTASKIEIENKGLGIDDIDEADVEGVITNYNSLSNTLVIQGQRIDASSATLFPSSLVLNNGINIEAEGSIVNGILVAQEIKQKNNKIKIQATIADIDLVNGTVTLSLNSSNIIVRVNSQTNIEDDNDNALTINNLQIGNSLEIKAFNDGTTTINAYKVEVEDSLKVKIEAGVDAFDAVNNTITLLGVVFNLDNTRFDNGITTETVNANFYSQLNIGEFVELTDDNGDGIFEDIEIDD